MKIKDFKLVKNRQRPDWCWAYEKKEPKRKFSIFTMNGGITFLASIEGLYDNNKWFSEYCEAFNSVDECLIGFNQFLTETI